MVAAGESGGILDTILNRLANYIEKAMKLKKEGEGRHDLPDRGLYHSCRRHRGHYDLRLSLLFRRCSHKWEGPSGAYSDRYEDQRISSGIGGMILG